jgi:hypothetical protein
MDNVDDLSANEKQSVGLGTIVLRAVIALNFVRFTLSFLPWFEGTANSVGFADQLFNPRHANGFRSDFLWLIFSTIAIFFSMISFIPGFRRDAKARTNVYLCVAWIAAFLIYIYRILVTGLLDFG